MKTFRVNGVDLSQITGVMITERRLNAAPTIDRVAFDLARAHGMKRAYKRYGARKFSVAGHIITNDRNLAEAARNSLLSTVMNADECDIITEYAGAERKIVAEIENPIINQLNGGHTTFDLQFIAYDPFMYDQTETTALTVTNATAQPRTDNITNSGSAPMSPKITITIDSLTASGVQDVAVVDPATGLGITVSRTWTAADVLVIDSLNGTVKVNGTDVEYAGTFPIYKPGARQIKYSDTFTARQVDISVTYYARYF